MEKMFRTIFVVTKNCGEPTYSFGETMNIPHCKETLIHIGKYRMLEKCLLINLIILVRVTHVACLYFENIFVCVSIV